MLFLINICCTIITLNSRYPLVLDTPLREIYFDRIFSVHSLNIFILHTGKKKQKALKQTDGRDEEQKEGS